MLFNASNYADFQSVVGAMGGSPAVYSYLVATDTPQSWWAYAIFAGIAVTCCLAGATVSAPATFATDFPGAIALTGPLSIIP